MNKRSLWFGICCLLSGTLYGADVRELINLVSTQPALCLTAAAVQVPLPPQILAGSVDTCTDHVRCRTLIDAVMALGQSKAREAIPVLVQRFPRVIHVEVLSAVPYAAGAGTFEDWIMTKTMAVKTKLELNPPFAAFNLMETCSDFIDVVPEHSIALPVYRGGVLQSGVVTVRVYFSIAIAACALSRISGADLGSSQARWRNFAETELLPLPSAEPASPAQSGPGTTLRSIDVNLDFGVLAARAPLGATVSVRLFNGSLLVGQLVMIDGKILQIDVPGAVVIPVRREAVQSVDILK